MTQASTTTHVNSSEAALIASIIKVPLAIREENLITRRALTNVGLAILKKIRDAFIIKSKGGTDESGDRWAPLAPSTIAQRLRKKSGLKADKSKQAVSDSWRQYYIQGLMRHKGNKAHAARFAWLKVKAAGHKPIAPRLASNIDILRDTGLLLRSLSPGERSPEQVFVVHGGKVILGTTRKGAMAHHKGMIGKLPQRRLWPSPQHWSASWKRDIVRAARQGIQDVILELAKRAR